MNETLSMAVIGCGAITENSYLPALAANRKWRQASWLVEPNVGRGRAMAERFGIPPQKVVNDLAALPPTIRLAINATPNHLHCPTTLAMIERGAHVLVEKPFAETAEDARTMLKAAARRCVLSVNQSRRLAPSNILARDILRSGRIGQVRKIVWHEGRKFDWPSQSGFNFRPSPQGRPRGVFLDIGIHVIDLLCWWLDARPSVLVFEMDGYGGPEASGAAILKTEHTTIEIRLSHVVQLQNRFLIEGTNGAIRGATGDSDRIEMQSGMGPWRAVKAHDSGDKVRATSRLIENVLAAAQGREALTIDAASTIAPLEVIDELYGKAKDVLPACYWDFVESTFPPKIQFDEAEKVA